MKQSNVTFEPCTKCGAKNKTKIEKTNSSFGLYILTDCPKCPYWKATLDRVNKSSSYSSGEWSRHTKQELETHVKDVLQPLKKDGTINKEFVQAHGTRTLEKEYKMDRGQIMNHVQKYG